MPGRSRSGIQSNSTKAPTTIEMTPIDPPMVRAIPWWKTSQGMLPNSERIISAIENP